jgi:hypothetical protein
MNIMPEFRHTDEDGIRITFSPQVPAEYIEFNLVFDTSYLDKLFNPQSPEELTKDGWKAWGDV